MLFAAQRIYISPCWAQWYFNQQKNILTKKTKKWFCLEVEFPQNTKQLRNVDFYFYLIQTNNPVQSAEVIWFPIMNKTNKLFDHFNIWIGIFYCIYLIIGHFCLNNKSIIMKCFVFLQSPYSIQITKQVLFGIILNC